MPLMATTSASSSSTGEGALLDVIGLVKTFATPEGERTTIVDVARFRVQPREQVAIMGSSGSGKTTFLNLIAGILAADRGRVMLAGTELTALTESGRDRFRASTIGYVFQSFNLLQGYTALENVLLGMLFGAGPDVAHARKLLDEVGLSHRLGYRPGQLSVGQQQRVAVARALANRPKLVLADEPTGNLDQKHAGEATALIRGVCEENGAALLLVSHDPAVMATFPRVEDLSALNRAASAHPHGSLVGGPA